MVKINRMKRNMANITYQDKNIMIQMYGYNTGLYTGTHTRKNYQIYINILLRHPNCSTCSTWNK